MIVLDLQTVAVMTTVVVVVAAVLFVTETLLRRDEGAGRIWALGFVAAMLTTLAYLLWAFMPEAWWPIAVGNMTFVTGTGSMWLGARRFNDRRMLVPVLVVAAAAVGAFVAVAIAGPGAGDWAGALWMFVALLVFAAAGATECFRGELRRIRSAWGLGIVLAIQAAYYVGRVIAFVGAGPESEVFTRWFGAIPTGVLTVVLTIVAVVVTSVLRAGRAELRGYVTDLSLMDSGIFAVDEMRVILGCVCTTASQRGEMVAVVSVRIDDLGQISSAFGEDTAQAIVETWRHATRRGAPTFAVVGEDDGSGLLVVSSVTGPDDARKRAAYLYRTLFDDLGSLSQTVIPVVGVGVALTSVTGYDPDDLLRVARETARRAATTVQESVLVADRQRDVSR